jgi:RHS repeat-associated protein
MYDAYGYPYTLQQQWFTAPFQFVGKAGYYNDNDSGMNLLGHRYYMSALGRFLTQDPSGHEAGLNLYQYADDNPLVHVDPSGTTIPNSDAKKEHPGVFETLFSYVGLSNAGYNIDHPQQTARYLIKQARDEALTVVASILPNPAPNSFVNSIRSTIKNDTYAIRQAEAMSQEVNDEANNLVFRLMKGTRTSGLGGRALGEGFYELRGARGARVIVKQTDDFAYDIVGKFAGHKRGEAANSAVIQRLIEGYRP